MIDYYKSNDNTEQIKTLLTIKLIIPVNILLALTFFHMSKFI